MGTSLLITGITIQKLKHLIGIGGIVGDLMGKGLFHISHIRLSDFADLRTHFHFLENKAILLNTKL
jgi:hypothetical protein